MVQLIVGGVILAVIAAFIIRRIIKLPSRYERKPEKHSPWSALDHGIDPSIIEERET
jgi:energy-converting hydrogenase Eha subunit A